MQFSDRTLTSISVIAALMVFVAAIAIELFVLPRYRLSIFQKGVIRFALYIVASTVMFLLTIRDLVVLPLFWIVTIPFVLITVTVTSLQLWFVVRSLRKLEKQSLEAKSKGLWAEAASFDTRIEFLRRNLGKLTDLEKEGWKID